MLQRLRGLVFKPGFLLAFYIGAAVFIAVQQILLGLHPYVMPKADTIPLDIMNQPKYLELYIGKYFTEYNNYVLFKSSWFHLLHGSNLYTLYPDEQWDFYKYSPTFSMFMGLLAYLPDYIGLTVWDILNGIAVFIAVRMLPFNTKTQCLLLWFLANEMLTCFSNTQSNGIMCGLIVIAYACLRNEKLLWATLWLVLASFIKLYGAIGFCMFLFFPGKGRAFIYAVWWIVLLAALPLLVTPLSKLVWQYHNWYDLMKADVSTALGMSVIGWLHTWFGLSNGYDYVTLTGILLFFIPFARVNMYKDKVYQMLILAFMLIWVIIFNRKAESPTYIIAVMGVGIWYFAMPHTRWRMALLLLVLVFTSLSTTDFFPRYISNTYIRPYTIKAVPCIITFCVILVELLRLQPARSGAKDSRLPAAA